MVVARFIERVHVMSKASTSTRAKRTTKRATAKNAKGAAKTASTPRTDSKQSQLIAMLKQPDGATIAEIAKALGWLPHTVRGAIAGALKKKLGLNVESEKVDDRGRVYRIAE
jgi:DNA-binding NarL/FixJ family response regulator